MKKHEHGVTPGRFREVMLIDRPCIVNNKRIVAVAPCHTRVTVKSERSKNLSYTIIRLSQIMRLHQWLLLSITMFAIWCISESSAHAQNERYELGKRLRRFEVAWQEAPAEKRSAVAPIMQKAVESFFSLQLAKAAACLDDAYFAVRTSPEPSAFERAFVARRFQVQPVTVDTTNPNVQIALKPFYNLDAKADLPSPTLQDAMMQLTVLDHNAKPAREVRLGGQHILEGHAIALDLPEGDYTLTLSARTPGDAVNLPGRQLSVISESGVRLQKINDWLKQQALESDRSDESETIRLTIRQIAQTVQSQIDGRSLETDYPAWRLLQLAEALIADPSRAPELFCKDATQSAWMVISHQRRSVPIRIHLPPQRTTQTTDLASEPSAAIRPILFAFHGAGGSENMFFETYGAGRLVDLASKKGWIVVAPRHPLLGMPLNYREMIESLSCFFPIDKEQVFLVGHSMGGAEVVRQVSLDAQPPQAAVVIGGGGSVKDLIQTKSTPWLVVAGEQDFGRGGAKALTERLTRLGCKTQYREYPNVEHMVIVQAVLDDVFQFLSNGSP